MQHVTLSGNPVIPDVELESPAGEFSLMPRPRVVRISSYTMDAQSQMIRWRGELLALSNEQRQTLRVLLQHAGQILSRERLSYLLHIAVDAVDDEMAALRATLEAAGVTWLPRRAEGCGYILWR